MNKKNAAFIRFITLAAALLAALGFAACGQTFSGQNTFLSAEAGEVEISGTALNRIEYVLSYSLDDSGVEDVSNISKIDHIIENITVTKHTGGEGSFTFNLVLKKGDKVLSLPLSATYAYITDEANSMDYRGNITYTSTPYIGYLLDGRLALCSYDGVFVIDPNTLVSEKLEFGRLPIDAPFAIKGVQLGHDGKFTLLATDKEYDYLVKLDENKNVDEYRKVSTANLYLEVDKRISLFFGKLVAAENSFEFLLNADKYGHVAFYCDGETDEYFRLVLRNASESSVYNVDTKLLIYYTPALLGQKNNTAVAAYDNGETIRLVNFNGNRLDGAFETPIYKPSYTYGKDVATYNLGTNFVEIEIDFAANTANVEYNFTKDMLSTAPLATSADGRYELYAANYNLPSPSHVVMYDTKKKEIAYLSAWLGGACPVMGHAGFFKDGDIYLQQFANLFVFNPETAGQGPTQTLNLLSDFGVSSNIQTFRRDPDDKSFVVVYSNYPSNTGPSTYGIAFYSADGTLTDSAPSQINPVYINNYYVELSLAVSDKLYTVKGYDDNDKLVVHFSYIVGSEYITNLL